MKRSGKNILIIGGICIGIGAIGMAVGKVAGADRIINQSLKKTQQEIRSDFCDMDEEFFNRDRNQSRGNHHGMSEESNSTTTANKSTTMLGTQNDDCDSTMNSVQKIKLEIKTRDVLVKTGNVSTITYDGLLSTDEIKQDSNELQIEDHSKLSMTKNQRETLEITVPNRLIHEIDVELGTGNVEVTGIDANMLEVEIGAGSVTLDQVTVHSQTELEVGTGDLETMDSVFYNNIDLVCGAGDVSVNGTLLGDSKIESGIGNVTLDLANKREDYSISSEGGMGDLTIDGETMGNGFLSEYKKEYSNRYALELEVGMGDTEINFQK